MCRKDYTEKEVFVMEQRMYKRRLQSERRRKRIIRRLIKLGCYCVMLGLLAAVLVVAIKFYKSVTVPDVSQLEKEGYPASLISLYEKNPETEQFVLGYFNNKDKNVEIDLSGEVEQGSIPLFLQWDERWGYETYGSDFLAVTGCGPTCLSMVWCGLSGDTLWNPLMVAVMAEGEGYYVEGAGSSWDLMTGGAAQLGLTVNEVIFDATHILAELKDGNPIICVMRPGDFTTSGHFIVLTGVNDEGLVTVCDPNSRKNSEKPWEVEELIPQIKNLWSYQYDEL